MLVAIDNGVPVIHQWSGIILIAEQTGRNSTEKACWMWLVYRKALNAQQAGEDMQAVREG